MANCEAADRKRPPRLIRCIASSEDKSKRPHAAAAYGNAPSLMEPPYILIDLDSSPAPRSRKELKELRRVLANYRTLVIRLGAARGELNTYIDKVPQK